MCRQFSLQGSLFFLFKIWFLCSNVQFYVKIRIFMFKCTIFMSDCVDIFLCKASVFFFLIRFYVQMCNFMSKCVFLCQNMYFYAMLYIAFQGIVNTVGTCMFYFSVFLSIHIKSALHQCVGKTHRQISLLRILVYRK